MELANTTTGTAETAVTAMTQKQLGLFQRNMNDILQNGRNDEMRKMISDNRDFIATTREKGIITMLLRFAIQQRDDALIATLVDRFSMKREFFELMVYKRDPTYSAQLFQTHIDFALLDQKDIRFMLENELTFLFRYLNGKFLHAANATTAAAAFDKSVLRRFSLQNCHHYIEKIIQTIAMNPKNLTQSHVSIVKKLRAAAATYDIIIDGGSVLHSRNGDPNPNDLQTMIETLQARGHTPLVVIHKKHTDDKRNPTYAPHINKILERHDGKGGKVRGVLNIVTPPCLNDDLFILLAYLTRVDRAPLACSIVTRDTYTDHIDIFKNPQKNISDDFGKYLANDLISFTNDYGHLQVPSTEPKPYSNCIQIVEPHAYIPLSSCIGEFQQVHL